MTHMPVTNSDPSLNVQDAAAFPVTWFATLAANANVALSVQPAPGRFVPTTIKAVRPGKVIAIQTITETLTGGTVTFTVMINGVASSLVLIQTSSAAHGATVIGSVAYNAGDTIGVQVTTTAGQLPSSGWDVLAWLQITETVA